MKRLSFFGIQLLILLAATLAGRGMALAAPQTQAGPYRVEITTEPATIAIGKSELRLKVTDAAGKPVEGAKVRTLTRMPNMTMGEREEAALPKPDAPGQYLAPAAFPMGGAYVVDLKISGAHGDATGTIPLQTGQSTGESGAAATRVLLPLAALLAVAFIAWSMKRNGQGIKWRALFAPQALAGIAVLLVMFFAARYAVNNPRRPGSMTPLEAQGMEMDMPAPVGATMVELATVQVKPVRSTVRYTGQAVGYIEQEVYPRVTGNLLWMPFYAGDTVRRGQLLARLDRSQIEPQIAGQRAARVMAEQNTTVARLDYEEALGAVRQAEAEMSGRQGAVAEARSEERKTRASAGAKLGALQEAIAGESKARSQVGTRQGAVAEAIQMERRARAGLQEAQTVLRSARSALAEAQSGLEGAREERDDAQAAAAALETQIPDAQAQLSTAQADAEVETRELARLQALVKEGIASKRDFERQQAQTQNARSRVKQAQARIAQSQAEARGAQSRVRRAEAAIRSAQAREQGTQAAIEGAGARIAGARADIVAAQARSSQQRSEATGADADVSGAGARIRQMQEDANAARAEITSAQARIRQAESDLQAHHAHVRQTRAAANAARQRIAQAQAGVTQAAASVAAVTTTAGYTEIRSLLDGVITQRMISPGTLVSPGQAILKIAQINPIRLQANVAEADLRRLRAGSLITVRDNAGKGKAMTARLSVVAPAVDPQTRTGIVEAIVTNPDRQFLPGEYVVMEIATGESTAPLSVPVAAVQQRSAVASGDKPTSYVWVAEAAQAGQFNVRPVAVQAGFSDGTAVEIRSGLKPGQRVVARGYQYLSEGDTVMTEQSTLMAAAPDANKQIQGMSGGQAQSAAIVVTEKGFEPASVAMQKGVSVKLTFTRKTDMTCATEVIMAEHKVNQKLPLNKPVTIEFTPKKSGTLTYACGMNMIRGQVVVR